MRARLVIVGVVTTCLALAGCASSAPTGSTARGMAETTIVEPSSGSSVLESKLSGPLPEASGGQKESAAAVAQEGSSPSASSTTSASSSASASASASSSATASSSPSPSLTATASPKVTVAPASGDAFYDPPSPLPTEPGTLLRVEPLGTDVPGGQGLRILYVSQRPDGTPVASSGMVFIPDGKAPAGGRPVVAWAHPTVGLGDDCAPSRRPDPLKTISGWLPEMMQRGWVVTASDYAGLGTPGPSLYLDGQSEARDVVNSVRAVRQVPDAQAGKNWIAWGHSQGGHSALWTAQLAGELAPELKLQAVAAAAPAAELTLIMGEQWVTPVAWVIAPEVMDSWPIAYPGQDFVEPISLAGRAARLMVAKMCINQAVILALITKYAKTPFFRSDPLQNQAWAMASKAQTPEPLPGSLPMMLVQSTADEVVGAWPNAKLQENWCAAGTDITAMWLSGIGHMKTADDAGPSVVEWIDKRFAGQPTQNTCNEPPPPVPQPKG